MTDDHTGGALSMRDALRACASYIEMFTPDGVRTPPPMQFITGSGEFAAAQVFADAARAALSRPCSKG